MTISGFSYVRNGFTYGVPFTEAIASILPICHQFVVVVGDSTDSTREAIENLNSSKIKIVDTVWDPAMTAAGKIFARQTNIALDHVIGDWLFHLQADEVIHENDLPAIVQALETYHTDSRVEGFILPFLHFWGDYRHIRTSRRVHRYEVRLLRNNRLLRSYRDSQGFRSYESLAHYEADEEGGKKLRVRKIEAPVYHYNGVRTPKMLAQKVARFGFYYGGGTTEIGEEPAHSPLDNVDRVEPFNGTHPAVMQPRIQAYPYRYTFNKEKAVWRLKDRLIQPLEDLLGFKFGEYRNYKLLR